MIYQQINNGESGSSVRAKINGMLSALITGAEGNTELWRNIKSLQERVVSLSDEELSKKYTELIRQGKEYTDGKVREIYSYVSASNGLIDVAVSLDYTSKFSTEQGGLVLTSLYGEFKNLHVTVPKPSGATLFILYKPAGTDEWRYSSLSLTVSFREAWGDSSTVGLSQKFLSEKVFRKENVVNNASTNEEQVLSAAFSTKITSIINVDTFSPLVAGSYESNTARRAIPQEYRKVGMLITYSTLKGQVVEQFIGVDNSTWENDQYWVKLNKRFSTLYFDDFIMPTGDIETGEPTDVSSAKILFNERNHRFMYLHNDKLYYVNDSSYVNEQSDVPVDTLFISPKGIVYNTGHECKIIRYVFPQIADNVETDDATKVLSASQGVHLKSLIDEGYKFFGSLEKKSSIEAHNVKGFYVLMEGGEYPNVQIKGKPISVNKGSLLLVELGGEYKVIEMPKFAEQSSVDTLRDTIEGFENTKTRVLTEGEYAALVSSGNIENDRFYFTTEE